MHSAARAFAIAFVTLLCLGAGPGGGPAGPAGGGAPPSSLGIPGLGRPIQVRIETYIDGKPKGVTPETTWKVMADGKPHVLYVTHIQVLTGNVAYYDIEQAASPYPIAFTLNGADRFMKEIAATPPDQKVALIGYLTSLGSRRLQIGGYQKLPSK